MNEHIKEVAFVTTKLKESYEELQEASFEFEKARDRTTDE